MNVSSLCLQNTSFFNFVEFFHLMLKFDIDFDIDFAIDFAIDYVLVVHIQFCIEFAFRTKGLYQLITKIN